MHPQRPLPLHRRLNRPLMRSVFCRPAASAAMPPPQAVRRRTTVTRAPRSRARLISATTRRDSWRSHVHRTRFRRPRSSSSADLPMCGVEGQDPSSFLSGVQGGYSLSRKRVSPFIRAALSAALPAAPVPQLPLHLCEKEEKETKSPRRERRGLLAVLCVYF